MSINLDFEVCALIMQIFFYFLFGFQYGKKSRDCIYYKRMLIMLFLATFSNLLANIYLNFPHKDYFVLFLLLSSFSFAGEIITLYYFYKYVLVLLPPAGKSRFESFNRVLAAAQGILCLLNPITGMIVRYDSEYKIIPGVLLFELYLVSAYFLILTFIKLCLIYKKLSRPQRIAVTSFVIIIVAGYVLQFLMGSMIQVKNFALTIGIIILLYSIETPDYEKMIIAQNELMQREKELQMAKDELDNQTKVVHQMTKTAFWQVGFGSDNKPAKYECSREALYMLGYSASEYKEDQFKELWFDAVHPDDKEAAKEAFLQGMDKENLHHEFRMRDKRGEYHWFLGTGTCICGSSGKRISYRGVIRNIDDEKTREILSQERLHALEALEKSQVELKSALMRAEEASRAKTVFLSNMSHDIRTPMNAIVGFTNLALDHLDEQEEVRDCLFTIKNSGKHLLNLINDILDMSRIESGKVAIKPLRGDLLKIINEIREMMQTSANEKSQALIENHEGIKNRFVMIDRLRFNQVVINCLSNAIKFTPSKGTISFTADQGEINLIDGKEFADYVFTVEDNGIGMSSEFVKNIFEPFERAVNSATDKTQGTGLGMAITKNLVEMMGGRIEVSSRINEGTKVVITLSFEIIEDYSDEEDNINLVAGLSVDDMFEAFRGDTFLVVDDNSLNRMIVRRLLADRGLVIEDVDSGQAAIKRLCDKEQVTPRLIFMDVMMPDMDGYQTTKIIRSLDDKEIAELPIIAVTANAFEEDKRLAIENGMDAHVAKPFVLNELAKTIYTLLNREN